MANSPAFGSAPILDIAQISTANANRDGSGTIVTVASGTPTGKVISNVQIKDTVNSSGGMVRFFVSPDSGTTNRLYTEVPVTAVTVGGTTAGFETTVPALIGLLLPGTATQLRAATQNSEAINIVVTSSGL